MQEITDRRRRHVLIVAMVGAAASSATGTLLFGAFPTIAESLDTSTSTIAWLGVAPAVAFAVSMPIFGKIGDLYGHRNVFIFGWIAASLFSFGAALSPNVGTLIVLRTASSLAGTSTSPAAYGVLASVYPRGRARRSVSRVTVALATAPLVSTALGGGLVDWIGWRVLFVAQGVASLIAVAFAVRLLPDTPRRAGVRIDVVGAALLAVGMTSSLLVVNRFRVWGWHHTGLRVFAVLGIVGLAAFVIAETRVDEPLLSPTMLRNRAVASAMGTSFFINAGFNGLDVLTPFAVNAMFGYSATTISWVNAVRAFGFAIGAGVARRILNGWGGRRVIYFGHGVMVLACLVIALGCSRTSAALFIGGLWVSSFGTGFARPSIATVITNAVPDHDAGIANGANNMAHHVGASIGQTVLIVVATSALPRDFALGVVIAAGFAAASLVTASFVAGRRGLTTGS